MVRDRPALPVDIPRLPAVVNGPSIGIPGSLPSLPPAHLPMVPADLPSTPGVPGLPSSTFDRPPEPAAAPMAMPLPMPVATARALVAAVAAAAPTGAAPPVSADGIQATSPSSGQGGAPDHAGAEEPPATAGAAAAGGASATPSTSAPTGTSSSTGAATTPQQLDELARRLYDPLASRLRAELLLDRERRGLRTDAW